MFTIQINDTNLTRKQIADYLESVAETITKYKNHGGMILDDTAHRIGRWEFDGGPNDHKN